MSIVATGRTENHQQWPIGYSIWVRVQYFYGHDCTIKTTTMPKTLAFEFEDFHFQKKEAFCGKISLIDLGGSERLKKSEVTGEQRKEA
eukprot:1386738-Amphidinium_carterae.1